MVILRGVLVAGLIASVAGGTWLAAEGAIAISRLSQPGVSILYGLYTDLRQSLQPLENANPRYLSREREFRDAFHVISTAGFGVGNVPGDYRIDNDARININEIRDGCLTQRPNLRKRMTFLRTNLFNPFDPVLLFYNDGEPIPAEAAHLIDRYGSRTVNFTTNGEGERITVPHVDAPGIFLVAGDSVANGVAIEDSETVSSQLQQRDNSVQYVNLGIGSANSVAIFCAIRAALDRYGDRVRGLIYIFCENDFYADDIYRDSTDVVAEIAAIRDQAGISSVRFVYAPYIYNVVPELVRLPGHSYFRYPSYLEERAEILAAAEAAGFDPIDITTLAQREFERSLSPFAPLAMFIDHVHLSPHGTSVLVDALLAPSE